VKTIRLSLTPGEWRKLRLWAATQDSSMNQLVRDIVRRELEHRPGQGF